MIVGAAVVIKGGDAGVKQAVGMALTAHTHDGAFVELQAHEPVGGGLRGIDQALEEFALGAEPVAVVNEPGVAWHQVLFEGQDFAVQGDGLDGTVGAEQNRAPRGFIAATAFHAHVAVLDLVQATNAVLAANAVEVGEHRGWTHLHTINGHDIAAGKFKFEDLGSVRGFLGTAGEAPHALFGGEIGVLQNSTFVADVQQIGVHGVRRAAFSFLEIHWNAVSVGVGQQFFTREQIPLSPRGDHFDVGHQGIGSKLKTHLVVALARGAVADGVGVGFLRNFHQSFGNQGPGNGGAQQILTFVQGVGPEHGKDKISHELFAQIFNEDVFGINPHFDGLGPGRFNLFTLTDIGGEGDHLTVIGVLQPLQNDGGIKPSRIGQDDAFGAWIGGGFWGGNFSHVRAVWDET